MADEEKTSFNLQDVLQKLPSMPQVVPDRDMDAKCVTYIKCESDGGLFTLWLGEYRPTEPFAIDERDRHVGKSATVIVGRYVLSPIALENLKRTIAAAEKFHVDHFGPMPDLEKHLQKVAGELPAPQLPAPEQRAGFRKQ